MDTNKKLLKEQCNIFMVVFDLDCLEVSHENQNNKKKLDLLILGDNYYQIDHYLTYSTKVAINRTDPKESLVWIDAHGINLNVNLSQMKL
ncbi:MAG: hypothetical protein CM15mP108_1930 [Gammaproteobacteria bacterium]|nr:MAG: hypothetical protein CM15mP108_1930 [Gammaproteobacteria bacterium]